MIRRLLEAVGLKKPSIFDHLKLAWARILARQPGGPDPYLLDGNTPNMKIGKLAIGWAWALLTYGLGSPIEEARRAALVDYIEQQKAMGLQCVTARRTGDWGWSNEQLTASHHWTWSWWVWAALVVARRNKSSQLSELRTVCTWWIGAQLAVWWRVDRHRTGRLAIAGARAGQDRADRGKDGVDTKGPRLPENLPRNLEWRLILKSRGQWRRGIPRRSPIAIALDEGYQPEANAELPHLAEPMVIRWHGDGSTSTSCANPPGQGGAQHVLQLADGSWRVLDAERTDDVTEEWRTP